MIDGQRQTYDGVYRVYRDDHDGAVCVCRGARHETFEITQIVYMHAFPTT